MSRSVFVWRMLYLPGIKRAGNAKAERCRFASVTGAPRIKEMHQVGFSTATVQRAFSWPPPEDQAEYVSHVQHAGIHTFSLQQEEVKATVSR